MEYEFVASFENEAAARERAQIAIGRSQDAIVVQVRSNMWDVWSRPFEVVWIITQDIINTVAGEKARLYRSSNYSSDIDLPFVFRLRDGDGEVYFYGKMNAKEFDPLDALQPSYGMTTIEFKTENGWEML